MNILIKKIIDYFDVSSIFSVILGIILLGVMHQNYIPEIFIFTFPLSFIFFRYDPTSFSCFLHLKFRFH